MRWGFLQIIVNEGTNNYGVLRITTIIVIDNNNKKHNNDGLIGWGFAWFAWITKLLVAQVRPPQR